MFRRCARSENLPLIWNLPRWKVSMFLVVQEWDVLVGGCHDVYRMTSEAEEGEILLIISL